MMTKVFVLDLQQSICDVMINIFHTYQAEAICFHVAIFIIFRNIWKDSKSYGCITNLIITSISAWTDIN